MACRLEAEDEWQKQTRIEIAAKRTANGLTT